MKNCLVVKLKASVNDSTLEKLGVFVVKTTSSQGESRNFFMRAIADTVITSPDGGKMQGFGSSSSPQTDWVDSLTIPAIPSMSDSPYGVLFEASHTYEIRSKYDILSLQMNHNGGNEYTDTSAFGVMPNLVEINADLKGELKELISLENLSGILSNRTANNDSLVGNIADIRTLTNMKVLQVGRNVLIKGKMCFAGGLTNLTDYQFRSTKIYGTIEDFVAAQRGAGRTTCDSMTINPRETSVTFNGTSIGANSATTLSWTASAITYNGTTINNSSVITPSELEQMIATWVDPDA